MAASANRAAGSGRRSRSSSRSISAKDAARAVAASTVTPPQPPSLKATRHQQLRQPLLGDPRLAGEGEGERIDRRHRAVRQHPVADGDMPVTVGVGQQRQAAAVGEDR